VASSLSKHERARARLGPREVFDEAHERTYENESGDRVNVTGSFVVDHLGEWPLDRLHADP